MGTGAGGVRKQTTEGFAMTDSFARLVDRIIDVARGVAPSAPSQHENRETTRLPFNGQVAVIRITPEGGKTKPVMAHGENISAGGLCVRTDRELPVGSRGAVLLVRSDGERVVLPAKIVYCHSYGTLEFECGLEFETQPAAITLNDFLDESGNPPAVLPVRAA